MYITNGIYQADARETCCLIEKKQSIPNWINQKQLYYTISKLCAITNT